MVSIFQNNYSEKSDLTEGYQKKPYSYLGETLNNSIKAFKSLKDILLHQKEEQERNRIEDLKENKRRQTIGRLMRKISQNIIFEEKSMLQNDKSELLSSLKTTLKELYQEKKDILPNIVDHTLKRLRSDQEMLVVTYNTKDNLVKTLKALSQSDLMESTV